MHSEDIKQPPLTRVEQQLLLQWARSTIEAALRGERPMQVVETELTEGLRAPLGAFVTIKQHGELRGCIGKLDFEQPLWANVIDAAEASALKDPRFPPIQAEELPSVRLEISVLNPPEDLPCVDSFDPMRQGIIVEKGLRHALLLPKVAQEYGWDAHKTLETVCWKAGLPIDAWRGPGTVLRVFRAFEFGETPVRDKDGKI